LISKKSVNTVPLL